MGTYSENLPHFPRVLPRVRPLTIAELPELLNSRRTLFDFRFVLAVFLHLCERVFHRGFRWVVYLDNPKCRFVICRLFLGTLRHHIRRILRIGSNFDPARADRVAHSEGKDRSREVVSNLLLLGVEPYTLCDVPLAGAAPDVERHLEPHGLFGAM